jgi:hypothetical protein
MALLTSQCNDHIHSTQKIENYKSCQTWLEGFNSPSTKKTYKIHLLLFCKYHNIDPDSLVQLKRDLIKTMTLDYVIHLKQIAKQSAGKARSGKLCVNSVRTYLIGIQSFLESNDITLNWKRIVKYCPEQVTTNLRGYTNII